MDRSGGYEESYFVAEFYDLVPIYQNRLDIPFFVEAAVNSKGKVLEVGCGTGRILIPTAKAGVTVVGMDTSSNMLRVCQEKLRTAPEMIKDRVRLVIADMRDFEFTSSFDLITFPFRSFQHLTSVEDQIACLSQAHKHLSDSGKIILDLFNPSLSHLADETHSQEFGIEPEFKTKDGSTVFRKLRIPQKDYAKQISNCEIIYYVNRPNGEKERLVHSFQMRYLFKFEAEHLLSRCGFKIEMIYSDYDKSPFGTKYPGELILVGKKA